MSFDVDIDKELLKARWYAIENDLIGGWAVSNSRKPLSSQNPANGEYEIGDFLTQKIAEHVCILHNMYVKVIEREGG